MVELRTEHCFFRVGNNHLSWNVRISYLLIILYINNKYVLQIPRSESFIKILYITLQILQFSQKIRQIVGSKGENPVDLSA